MNNETVSETEANKECDNLTRLEQLADKYTAQLEQLADEYEYTFTDEQIMMQKEAMRALYESMQRGKHSRQRGTKGAFGAAKNKYNAQTHK